MPIIQRRPFIAVVLLWTDGWINFITSVDNRQFCFAGWLKITWISLLTWKHDAVHFFRITPKFVHIYIRFWAFCSKQRQIISEQSGAWGLAIGHFSRIKRLLSHSLLQGTIWMCCNKTVCVRCFFAQSNLSKNSWMLRLECSVFKHTFPQQNRRNEHVEVKQQN